MAETLYPAFDAPIIIAEDAFDQQPLDVVAPVFNMETVQLDINGVGQAVIGDEKDAYRFWVMKCLLTERYQYPAYSSDFGVELANIVRSYHDRGIAESEIKRTITEALMIDARTKAVDSFAFEWKGDNVWITFQVESVYGTEFYEMTKGGEAIGTVNIRPA